MLTIQEIMDLLPHRYPFLLVDRVVAYEPGIRIVGLKNVTINEPFFEGHFPGHPIMPGVLIVEALAQTGGIFALKELGGEKKLAYFAAIERCRFRRPVVPGDQLRIEVQVTAWRRTAVRMQGVAYVGDKRVAEATVSCQVVQRGAAPAP